MPLYIYFILLVSLSACDFAYVNSRVVDVSEPTTNKLGVDIIPMTIWAVELANESVYRPKGIPVALRSDNIVTHRDYVGVQTKLPADNTKQLYRLGINDIINISFNSVSNGIIGSNPLLIGDSINEEIRNVDLSQENIKGRRIRNDGSVTIPKFGRLFLDGKTISQAEEIILNIALEKQLSTDFDFDVISFRSQKITIGGLVEDPGVVPITIEPLTLLSAIQSAGGPIADEITGFEDLVVYLYRDGTRYQVSYQKLKGLNGSSQAYLKNGDNISIENTVNAKKERYNRDKELRSRVDILAQLGAVERDYVYVTGSVNEQSRFPLPFEKRAILADALYSSEVKGLNSFAGNPSQIYVLRADSLTNRVNAYHLDAKNAANMSLATQFYLRPNDIIFVGTQPITPWNRAISQLLPTVSAANSTSSIGN